MPTQHTLEQQQHIAKPVEEVFAFFAKAENLEKLTPSFLRFRIETPLPIAMQEGTLIDYRLSLYGVPMRWRTRIEVFEVNRCFVDVQLKGPYALWRHTHTFLPATDGGTDMHDRVDYALPMGFLGDIAHALFVRRSVERIFSYRRAAVESLWG